MDNEIINIACNHALINIDNNGGPFGAIVIDQDGFVIGVGVNRVVLNKDPTAHAEIIAIRNACIYKNTFSLDTCKLYTSCEPCPMCLSAIYWSGIKEVYYGSTKEDAKKMGFADDFIYKEFSLPKDERSVKMHYIKGDRINNIFEKWSNKVDKKMY